MNTQQQPIMTVYSLGDFARIMRSRKTSNVVPIRKVQPTPQQVRKWQIENKVPA